VGDNTNNVENDATLAGPILPRFKERIMYGNIKNENDDLIEKSYPINQSYSGILRISPNSTATLLNKNNSISITDEIKDYVNYSDHVFFALESGFVPVSTSDGVSLDMNIGNGGVEYNNLYVMGTVRTPSITVYMKNINDSSFTLGALNMPYKPNTVRTQAVNDSTPTYKEVEEKDSNEEREKFLDETYILVNTATGGKSDFTFKSARTLIKEFIDETLLKLATLPSGSIHWIPVNIIEYNRLMKISAENNGGHNLGSKGNIPLIRDFLLCDGSCYRNEDFPELAKILYKEEITYWESSGKKNVIKTGNAHLISDTGEKCFRVPDMRTMFMQYVVPQITTSRECIETNKVGSYEHDYPEDQESQIRAGVDKHYHYIVLDNNIKNQPNTLLLGARKLEGKKVVGSGGFNFKSSIENDKWADIPENYQAENYQVEDYLSRLKGKEDAYLKDGAHYAANGATKERFARPLAKYGSMKRGIKGIGNDWR
jgi:hypothetical protein